MCKNRLFLICIASLAASLLTACIKGPSSQAESVFNTVCTINLFNGGKSKVYRDVFRRLHEIEDRMSLHVEGSDVSRINANAGREAVKVHDDVFEVIEKAVLYAEISGGAFDPSVGPVVRLWGITGDMPRVPSQEEIDEVLPLVNWRDIELDRGNKSVLLKKPGMILDLGAIAKGYAADEAAAIIRKAHIKRAIIDLGGNILCLGVKQDKTPWNVGLQNPNGGRGVSIGMVQVGEKTVVTSGVYERFFDNNGVRYHHIFLPSNGYPVRNGLLAVTIITDASADADALSTAVFVLGYEQGMALIESLEGVEAVFVFEDQSIRLSEGAEFIVTDSNYRIVF